MFYIFKAANISIPMPLPLFIPGTDFCATGDMLVKTEGSRNFRWVLTSAINATYII